MQIPIYHLFPECVHCGQKHYPEVKEHCIELLKQKIEELKVQVIGLSWELFKQDKLVYDLDRQLKEYDIESSKYYSDGYMEGRADGYEIGFQVCQQGTRHGY